MKIIPLTQGKEAKVDDQFYDQLIAMGSWRFNRTNVGGYARNDNHGMMHRVVWQLAGNILLPFPKGQIDHRDLDKLNNQISNLRNANASQQKANMKDRVESRGYLKGVYLTKSGNWSSRIGTGGGKSKHLGTFETGLEAALAYDEAALELFGEFAHLNFPEVFREAG